jgi:hypothetical protein
VQRLRFEREEHEHPQSMIGVNRQAHGCDGRRALASHAVPLPVMKGGQPIMRRQPQPLVTL